MGTPDQAPGQPGAASWDVRRAHPGVYRQRAGEVALLDVPPLSVLAVDGHGDPNTAPAYREAVTALYTLGYAVRAAAKRELGRVHTVGPLEALWSAADLDAFLTRDKDAWDWTLLVAQPDWVGAELVARAAEDVRSRLPAAGSVRFDALSEGRCAQVLHVGSYDDEGPVLRRLHREFIPAHGLVPTGRHHEVYLSDPRRTPPARLRTLLRQPVGPAHGPH